MLTVVLGEHDGYLNQMADLLRETFPEMEILQVSSKEAPGVETEALSLLILVDASDATLEAHKDVLNRTTRSVLSLACLSPSEVASAQEVLLDHVDDILLHPEDLTLRLPFAQQRLQKRQDAQLLNRAILETIVDGIISIDNHGIIRTFNPSAERIFGYEATEVVGGPITKLMPEPYRSEHQSYIERYNETGEAKIIGIGREVVGLRKNGEHFPMDLAVSEVITDGEKLYTGVVRDITERRQLEHEILRITDQERRRIGQDLHDGLGQMLTGIGLISRSLANRLEREGSPYVEDISEITELIQEADRNSKTIARGLVPVELDEHGLEHSLQTLAVNVEKLFGCSCSFSLSGTVPELEISTLTNLYRITQEAVSNAIKHGKAKNVAVRLNADSKRVFLWITDDGIGIEAAAKSEQGMGIPIMKYRARVIGATLEIKPAENRGTSVICMLALDGKL